MIRDGKTTGKGAGGQGCEPSFHCAMGQWDEGVEIALSITTPLYMILKKRH